MNAACGVFAERGYRDAKVADICQRAGTNIAAVNYYFGDKATLYVEAWNHAFKEYSELNPPVPVDASPEEQLHRYIHSLMQKFTEKGSQGQFTRLYLMELVNPSGLIHDSWHELIEPRRQELLRIVREIMGKELIDEKVLFCEMSIINQCRVLLTISPPDMEYLLGQRLSPDLIKRLADHVVRFSVAGIKAAAGHLD